MRLCNKYTLLILSSVIATFVMTGCGAKGAKFTNFKTPSENKSMLYVYRPSSFVGGGVYYDIHASELNKENSDTVIGTLRNGGYIEKEMNPTENLEVWAKTESKASVSLDLKANKIYCIKGGVGMGFLVGRPNLTIVDNAICEKEILETQLSN